MDVSGACVGNLRENGETLSLTVESGSAEGSTSLCRRRGTVLTSLQMLLKEFELCEH